MSISLSRFQLFLLLLLFSIPVSGCGRSASPPKQSAPQDPLEQALDIVTAIYTISARVQETPPRSWDDLIAYAEELQDPARKDALDAIEKIKSLDYKVTWGMNLETIKDQNADYSEFVIIESPDGRLKSTFGGQILRSETAETLHKPEAEPEETTTQKDTDNTETTP